MRLCDPMYGDFQIPDWLSDVVKCPEVQRIRDVSLMNTKSDTLSGLSDVSRFTHSLGVVNLGLKFIEAQPQCLNRRESRTFLASLLLHDVATPAFGHSLEGLLEGWRHETFLRRILLTDAHETGEFDRIFAHERPMLRSTLERHGVDIEHVAELVLGSHALGKLVAGQLDLDNLDTAFRMCHALGVSVDRSAPAQLAGSLRLIDGELCVLAGARSLVEDWVKARKRAYTKFLLDPGYIASQAILTEAMKAGIESGMVTADSWNLTDSSLLHGLSSNEEGSANLAARFERSDYWSLVDILWLEAPRNSSEMGSVALNAEFEEIVAREGLSSLSKRSGGRVRVHIVVDNGAIQKRMSLPLLRDDGVVDGVLETSRSRSVIIGLLVTHGSERLSSREQSEFELAANYMGLNTTRRRNSPLCPQQLTLA